MKGRTETVICGGSNLRAPMKLDFISSLRDVSPGEWPEIVIVRTGNETEPACFVHAEDAGDIFNCIGIVAAPSEPSSKRSMSCRWPSAKRYPGHPSAAAAMKPSFWTRRRT